TAALVIYAVLVAVVERAHEPWRDEADPWLLARDASFSTFFHRMGLSGTPGLWHTLLVPLARSGLPYGSQAVLHVAIAIATAAVAAIMLAGGLPAAIQVYPPSDAITSGVVMRYVPQAVVLAIGNAFFPALRFPDPSLSAGLGVIVIGLAAVSLGRQRGPLLVL